MYRGARGGVKRKKNPRRIPIRRGRQRGGDGPAYRGVAGAMLAAPVAPSIFSR